MRDSLRQPSGSNNGKGWFGKKAVNATPTDFSGSVTSTQVDPEKHGDAGQQIEGVTTGSTMQNHTIDSELERRVIRKLDRRLPPLVSILFLLSFLDRSNIGNAKIAGMEDDLNLDSNRYTWLLTIFYIAYILGQVQAFMWKIVKPHTWACIIILAWGIFATCQAAVQSWAGEMALRFLLGLAEAGFGPSIPYLLSFFYLRHEIGSRIGFFLSMAPLASTFSGALAYGITSGHPSLASWRLLFLIEGLPTIAAAPMTWFLMPDSPASAKFFNEEEKIVARARGVRQEGQAETVRKVNFKEIGETMLDAKAWFTALMYFSCNVSYSSLPVFLPTILKEMGFSAINAQGLSAPPFFVSFLVTCLSTWIADRTQQRGLMIIFLSLVAGIGYIILATAHSTGAKYFAVFLAASGVFPAIGNILPWVTNNQGSSTRRGAGIMLLNLVGQCGPLLGTRVFPETDAPQYVKGQSICAAFMFFNALLAFGNRCLLQWENKKLDRKYGVMDRITQEKARDGKLDTEEGADASVGEENYGRNFRYVL